MVQEIEEEVSLIERRVKKVQLQSVKYAKEAAIMRITVGLKERHNAIIAKNLDIWLRIVDLRIHNKLVLRYGEREGRRNKLILYMSNWFK